MTEMHDEEWLKEKYQALGRAERAEYALVSLKIKRFRTFNRVFGRAVGDELIQEVYDAISSWLKEDEYIAHGHLASYYMLVRAPEDYEGIFQRIIDLNCQVRDRTDPRFEGEIFSGMGVFHLSAEPVDFYTAQYNADICRAECPERNFRNSHMEVYGKSYQDKELKYFDLRHEIKPAMEHGDFKLYLQPKVDMKTGKVERAEALVRWIDPKKGMIPIMDFMPTLEENGLIQYVDLYQFGEVCQYINRWIEVYGRKIAVSVNLSSCAFNYLYFIQDYKKVYDQYNTPKDCIEFELMESSVLNQVERVRRVVGEIKECGFTCSLDDFGSGFSNFDVLTTEGLSMLKIDRSLFRNDQSEREHTVLRHIIESAHELGMKVVAEGVETRRYVDFLRENGCDYIQGYVFYKPMPVEEFERRFLKNGERVEL